MKRLALLAVALAACHSPRDCHVRATAATHKLRSAGVPAQTLNVLVAGEPHAICIYFSEGRLVSYEDGVGSTVISDTAKTFPSAERVATLCYWGHSIGRAVWQKDMLPLSLGAQ